MTPEREAELVAQYRRAQDPKFAAASDPNAKVEQVVDVHGLTDFIAPTSISTRAEFRRPLPDDPVSVAYLAPFMTDEERQEFAAIPFHDFSGVGDSPHRFDRMDVSEVYVIEKDGKIELRGPAKRLPIGTKVEKLAQGCAITVPGKKPVAHSGGFLYAFEVAWYTQLEHGAPK